MPPHNDPSTEPDEKPVKKNTLAATEEAAPEEPEAGGGNFITLYTSLMLLLLSFFIVLFSMASTSTNKFNAAKRSINEEFTTLGLSNAKKALVFIYSYMKLKSSIPFAKKNTDENASLQEGPIPDGAAEGEVHENSKEAIEMTANLILFGLNVQRKENDLLIKIPSRDLFIPHTDELNEKGKLLLSNMLGVIGNKFDSLTIHAYSDEKTGTDAFVLSTRQAYHIASYVSQSLSLPLSKIAFYGYGPYRQLYYGKDSADKTDLLSNERIEFWITNAFEAQLPAQPQPQ